MSKETITHEIKLQPALLVILGVMAFGILVIAFPNASPIQEAMAEIMGGSLRISHSGSVMVH
jgi:hypothetical protein